VALESKNLSHDVLEGKNIQTEAFAKLELYKE
jgi:hypothetical protein